MKKNKIFKKTKDIDLLDYLKKQKVIYIVLPSLKDK